MRFIWRSRTCVLRHTSTMRLLNSLPRASQFLIRLTATRTSVCCLKETELRTNDLVQEHSCLPSLLQDTKKQESGQLGSTSEVWDMPDTPDMIQRNSVTQSTGERRTALLLSRIPCSLEGVGRIRASRREREHSALLPLSPAYIICRTKSAPLIPFSVLWKSAQCCASRAIPLV